MTSLLVRRCHAAAPHPTELLRCTPAGRTCLVAIGEPWMRHLAVVRA